MKCPNWLSEEGKRYYKKNSPALIEAGTLNDNNVDKFLLLCKCWELLRESHPEGQDGKERVWFIGLLKQYQALSKDFQIDNKHRNIHDIIRNGFDDND